MFPSSKSKERVELAPKGIEIPVGEGEDATVSVTPSRSPGQAADVSPLNSEKEEEGDGPEAEARQPTAVVTAASPHIDIPTPRGVEQMSPGLAQEPAVEEEEEEAEDEEEVPKVAATQKINVPRNTPVTCLFCQRVNQGSQGMRRHAYACAFKPILMPKAQLDEMIENYLRNHVLVELEREKSRGAGVVARGQAGAGGKHLDPDETDEDSASDDVGRRSDEARVKQSKNASHYLDESDDDHIRLDIQQRMLEGSDDEQTASRMYTAQDKRERRPSMKASNAKSNGFSPRAEHGKPMKMYMNISGGWPCDVCGFVAKSSAGLKIHFNRTDKHGEVRSMATAGEPLVVGTRLAKSITPAEPSPRGELQIMPADWKQRKCLLAEYLSCPVKCASYDDLVMHMLTQHRVKVVRRGSELAKLSAQNAAEKLKTRVQSKPTPELTSRPKRQTRVTARFSSGAYESESEHGSGSDPQSEVEYESESEMDAEEAPKKLASPSPSATKLRLHAKSRKCRSCSHEPFATFKALLGHYAHEHGIMYNVEGSAAASDKLGASAAALKPTTEPPKPTRVATKSRKIMSGSERTCEECDCFSGSFRSLEKHYNTVHGYEVILELQPPLAKMTTMPAMTKTVAQAVSKTKSKSKNEVCPYCKKPGFEPGAGFASHQRACVKKVTQAAVEVSESDAEDDAARVSDVQETMCDDLASDDEDVSQPKETWTIMQGETRCPGCQKNFKSDDSLKRHIEDVHNATVERVDELSRKRARALTNVSYDQAPAPKKMGTRNNELAIVRPSTELEVSRSLAISSDAEFVPVTAYNALVARLSTLEARLTALENSRGSMRQPFLDPFDPNVGIKRIQVAGQLSTYGFSPITCFGRLVWLTNVSAANLELPVEGQMSEALDYLVQLLVRAGTDVLHLISIKIYLCDNRDMAPVVKVWDDFFLKHGVAPNARPVRNTVISHGFSKHRLMKVELHGHAVLPATNETALPTGVPN